MAIAEEILKKVTPERVEKEIQKIEDIHLPDNIQVWVDQYDNVGNRPEFIWKMFFIARQEISYVPTLKIHKDSLEEVKFLIAVFVVLLDDVADKTQNERLLIELSKIPFRKHDIKFYKLAKKEAEYINFVIKVWRRINKLIQKYPRYKEFSKIFEYDIKQTVNALEYDQIVNKNRYLINMTEAWLYQPNTMRFVPDTSVELMSLNKFNWSEVSMLREVTWETQKMLRIGNWISTWEREIDESDFTSGVFAYAIDLGSLSVPELTKTNRLQIVRKIEKAGVEKVLLREWDESYNRIYSLRSRVRLMNIQKVLKGLTKLLQLELISKGYK